MAPNSHFLSRAGLAAGCALLLSLGATGARAEDAARNCPGHAHVTVGGVTGFASLEDPAATAELRKSCNVGLYIHAEGWRPLDDSARAKLLSTFAGTGPAVIELGFNPSPGSYFRHYYDPTFPGKGVHAETAIVNGLCSKGIDAAKQYIDAAREHGLKRVAVVFAPNSGQYRTAGFDDPQFSCPREAALYGKALAIDAPPHVYFALKDGYQKFVVDELRWARQNGVPSYYIVSPNGSGGAFAQESSRVIQDFKRQGAAPTDYVFETYDINRTDVANKVGSESQPETVVGTARRLLPMISH